MQKNEKTRSFAISFNQYNNLFIFFVFAIILKNEGNF